MPTVRDRVRALFAASTDAPPAPVAGEIAIADTRRWSVAQYGPQLVAFNPDALVQKKGGLQVYDDMREDDQIKPCLWLTKAAIMGPGWEIETEDDSDGQEDLATELWRTLTDVGFDDVLWELLSALDYGHAIAEKIYTLDGGGLKLQAIKPRAPHAIEYDQDPHGDIRSIEQQQGGMRVQMPPAKFLHFVAQPEFDNAYGRALLREAYRPWWYKTNFTQWWAMFGEKLAIPPIIAKHPGSETARATAVRDILSRLQAGTALTVSGDWDIATLETQRDPRVMFEAAVNHFDLRISRALLVPEKSGFTGAGQQAGSYALSQTQFDTYLFVLQMFRRRLERTVQRQLLPELTELLAPGAEPPQFKLLPLTEDNKQALAEVWIKAVTAGAAMTGIADENHLREVLGFPEREEHPEIDGEPRGATTLTPLGQPLPPSPEEVELNKAKAAALTARPAGPRAEMGEGTYNRHPQGTGDVVGDTDRDGGKFAPKDAESGGVATLEGSDKQVEWAEDIRRKRILRLDRAISVLESRYNTEDWFPLTHEQREALHTVMTGLGATTNAKAWIENRDKSWTFILNEFKLLEPNTRHIIGGLIEGASQLESEIAPSEKGRPTERTLAFRKWLSGDDDVFTLSETETWRPLTASERRANLPEVAATVDMLTDTMGTVLADVTAGVIRDLTKRAERLTLDGKSVRAFAIPEAQGAKIRRVVDAAVREAYGEGQRGVGLSLASMPRTMSEAETAVLERYQQRGGLVGARATEFFRNKAFWVTGLLLDDVLKRAQTVLFNALKQDKTKGQVLYDLDQTLNEYIPERDSLGRIVNVPHRIETIARTNIAEAVNEGRWAAMTDPELDGFITLIRYSAVLDNRTRDTHRAWDGVTLPPNHPAWFTPKDQRPPNGFNCRCVAVPVSAGDEDAVQTPEGEIPRVSASDDGFE